MSERMIKAEKSKVTAPNWTADEARRRCTEIVEKSGEDLSRQVRVRDAWYLCVQIMRTLEPVKDSPFLTFRSQPFFEPPARAFAIAAVPWLCASYDDGFGRDPGDTALLFAALAYCAWPDWSADATRRTPETVPLRSVVTSHQSPPGLTPVMPWQPIYDDGTDLYRARICLEYTQAVDPEPTSQGIEREEV